MNTLQKTLAGALLATLAASAQAASLSLVYTGVNDINDGVVIAQFGESLTFDIVMDFTDTPTLGGGFDVLFDTSVLAFDTFDNYEIGEDGFGRDPDVLAGQLESWAFGAFAGLTGPETVGTVTFTYLGGSTELLLAATAGIGGPFVSLDNPGSTLDVNFGSAQIGFVPVPAAVWFFISGLGALFGVRRRARV